MLRNTYLLLAVSLIPTVIGAAVGTTYFNFSFMRSSPIMSVIIMMAVFYGWIFMIEKNRNSALGVGLPYALTVAVFGGTAEYVALWFKDIGHESGFYWYVTGCIACSLLVYIRMPDTRKHSLIDQDEVQGVSP